MKISALAILVIFFSSIQIAYTDKDVPKELLNLFEKDKLINNILIKWKEKKTVVIHPSIRERIPHLRTYSAEQYYEYEKEIKMNTETIAVKRVPRRVKIVTDKGEVIIGTEHGEHPYTSAAYFGLNWGITGIEGSFEGRENWVRKVYSCEDNCAFYPLFPHGGVYRPTTPVELVFLATLNPLRLHDLTIERVEDNKNEWVLYGKSKLYRSMRWKMHLRKPDGVPMIFEMGSANRQERYITKSTIKVKGKEIPNHVVYSETIEKDRVDTEFILLEHKDIDKVEIDIPLGTSISDYRLVKPFQAYNEKSQDELENIRVLYPWSGRLLSEAELQQLAYQQGHLIPPDAPARRYSLWMFLPAVILFGLAGYLYYRQKRK